MGSIGKELEDFIHEAVKDVDPISKEVITPNVRRNRLSFLDTLRAIVVTFGGPEGVAEEFKATYTTCTDSVKATMLNRIVQALESYGEDETEEDAESIDAIEEELREIATEELLERLPDTLRKEVEGHLTE